MITLAERPGGLFDVTPPQLLSLRITPTLIDVREEAQMFETSVRVSDDFSGTAQVTIKVSGRLGSDQTSLMRAASFETGSRHDGYWKLKKVKRKEAPRCFILVPRITMNNF